MKPVTPPRPRNVRPVRTKPPTTTPRVDALMLRIRNILQRDGITQVALAEHLGINKCALNEHLMRRRSIPLGELALAMLAWAEENE